MTTVGGAHGNGVRGDASEACLVVHGREFAQRIGVARCRGGQHGHAEGRGHGRGDAVFIGHELKRGGMPAEPRARL